ncbi:MAG: uracil-DNA glycosylase [Bdellovibrionales bacterium]|nr:uracil-DNA glycosylase [Bdellovibrionales bacterium]
MGNAAEQLQPSSGQVGVFQEAEKPTTWRDVLGTERGKRYFTDLLSFVENERASGKTIYPKNDEVFAALALTPFEKVKVVILGQDPYHGPNQAHGLCFSVQPGVPSPPSLENVFKELKNDLGIARPGSGHLEGWARQGVLLLNAVLTVEAGQAGSHANKGWERFTDKIVAELNARREGLVFLLWGSYAQKKGSFIDTSRHAVLTAPHPSPLSAHRGFLGCGHFSKANAALEDKGLEPIRWEQF